MKLGKIHAAVSTVLLREFDEMQAGFKAPSWSVNSVVGDSSHGSPAPWEHILINLYGR